jgi:hypothetical protein
MTIEADRRTAADRTARTSNNGVLIEHPSVREISNLFSRRGATTPIQTELSQRQGVKPGAFTSCGLARDNQHFSGGAPQDH